MKNPWFFIAVVEFVILLIILGPKVLSLVLRSNGESKPKKKKDEGRKGIIKDLDFVIRGLMGAGGAVSIFEIHEDGGKIFYAGVFGHDYTLSNGATIEFWPTSETIVRKETPINDQDDDGIRHNKTEETRYYQLEKYRIIPEEHEVPAIETTAKEVVHEV